jgi:hypothetical protein
MAMIRSLAGTPWRFAGPNTFRRMLVVVAAILGSASPLVAQSAGKAADQAPMAKALEGAMTPGEGQKRLNPLIGTFNVAIKTWVTPEGAPIESTAASVNTWVLGGRYVQMMLNGDAPNAPFSGTGHIAYDNVSKNYQAAWMDTGSTGITLYTGKLDASGKSALMKGSVTNPLTGKSSPVELRMTIEPDGSHLTQLWGQGKSAKMVKLMQLQYTKVK